MLNLFFNALHFSFFTQQVRVRLHLKSPKFKAAAKQTQNSREHLIVRGDVRIDTRCTQINKRWRMPGNVVTDVPSPPLQAAAAAAVP
jgi:hypothetical protein